MPSILFIHENFPAQFGGLAQYLAGRGWRVVFATAAEHVTHDGKDHMLLPSVHVVRYKAARPVSEHAHPYLAGTEKAVLNGQGFARVGAALAKGGFAPDVVVAHSGWGSGSLARIVWPHARYVQYLEWWYKTDPVDVEPGIKKRSPENTAASTLCRNLPFWLDAQSADAILVPTQFQADQIPDLLQPLVTVIHDGVDEKLFRPATPQDAPFSYDGLPDDAKIITYATRGMEPMRGFPQFMTAWAKLQGLWPDLHCVIAGKDRVCYGARLAGDQGYKTHMLGQFEYDEDRLHFTGLLPKKTYRALLQRSSAHVYLTRPFVLSWSLIEAMMTGAPVVASATPPVQEAAPIGMASLVDIDNPGAIVKAVSDLLSDASRAHALGVSARTHARSTYATAKLYPKHENLFASLVSKGMDQAAAS